MNGDLLAARFPRRGFRAGAIALVIAAAPVPCARSEIVLAPNARILEANDVRGWFLETVDGVDRVAIPGHERWALVGTDDPAYASHRPVSAEPVAAAWRALRGAFRERVDLTIVILPRPRAALPNSSAEDDLIYLSPGAAGYAEAETHFLLAHEFGHCVHRALLDTEGSELWDRYLKLRGIADASVFHDWADHPNRPREIFAEDFRYLFGGPLANYSASIENADLPLPDDVPGLEAFMLALVGESAEAPAWPSFEIASAGVASDGPPLSAPAVPSTTRPAAWRRSWYRALRTTPAARGESARSWRESTCRRARRGR